MFSISTRIFLTVNIWAVECNEAVRAWCRRFVHFPEITLQ